MKKKIIKAALIILAVPVLILAVALSVFSKEIKTITSLETYDIKDLYSIDYTADYGFDDFLKVGAKDWDEYSDWIKKTIAKGIASKFNPDDFSCSSFVTRNEKGEVLFGRNFDHTWDPVVMTTTKPDHGYAVIGACSMGFLNFGKNETIQAHTLNMTNAMLLCCPYFTTDGMNEYGVAMSVLDCGHAWINDQEDAPTLVTDAMIRMVLENAKNVDEAIELFKSYNISHVKPNHHFMIADASGRSVVMEYTRDGTVAVESSVVTNFDLYDEPHSGSGQDRYRTITTTLEEKKGMLTDEEALDLLAKSVVGSRAQYSTLYNLTTGEVYVFTHGDRSKVQTLQLEMRNE